MTEKIIVPYVSLSRRVALRFFKVFMSGGLASLTVQFAQVPELSDMMAVRVWGTSLVIAFIAGGVAALEKYFSE